MARFAEKHGSAAILSFEVAGETQLNLAITRVTRAVSDLRPLWEMFRTSFIEAEEATFAAQGGTSGKWPGLSPTYSAWKANHYPGSSVMVRTGALLGALTGGGDFTFTSAPRALAIGAGGQPGTYGGYHQRGEVPGAPVRKTIDVEKLVGETWAKESGEYMHRVGNMWSSGRAFALSPK